MSLWGFRNGNDASQRFPTDREIQRVLSAVGIGNIVLEGPSVGLRQAESRLDLGGIAVGYSVDRAVAILKEEGIESAFINHSGDAFALGSPPDAAGWEVAIPNPQYPAEMLVNMELRDRAISTSGAYEKFVTINGRSYGHIIDPHSGAPSRTTLSTSVIAKTALEADALSTGIFCMDWDSASSTIRTAQNVELIAIKQSGYGCEVIRASG